MFNLQDQQSIHWGATANAWAGNVRIFARARGDIAAALANGLGPAVDLSTGY